MTTQIELEMVEAKYAVAKNELDEVRRAFLIERGWSCRGNLWSHELYVPYFTAKQATDRELGREGR